MSINHLNEKMNSSSLSLKDKVSMMCVVGTPTFAVDQGFRSRMERNKFGGIGIFPHNIHDEQQTRQLMEEVQAIAKDSEMEQPFYVSVDEEAGSLSNFKAFFPYVPGNRAIGLSEETETAYQLAKVIGSQLHALGIPMNWGPVLDVNTNIDNPVIGVRSFGEEPGRVSELGREYIRGLHEAGVAATAKHFPGHGQVSGDSHYVLPECGLTLQELMDGPLQPFVASIAAGVDSIMMGHLVFPQIAESNKLPASLSPFFVYELLRKALGFEGVICTDDVEMGAIQNHFKPEEIGVLAVRAGNDMILLCHTPEFQDKVIAGIIAAVENGVIAESRIDESIIRIRQLYGKFQTYRKNAKPIPREDWGKKALELARRTVRVQEDKQKLLPLNRSLNYLLILPTQEKLTLADNTNNSDIQLLDLLQAEGIVVHTAACTINPDAAEIDSLVKVSVSYDVILHGTLNAHLFDGQLQLAKQLASHKPLINLILRNPYDLEHLPVQAGKILVCSTSDYSMKALLELLV